MNIFEIVFVHLENIRLKKRIKHLEETIASMNSFKGYDFFQENVEPLDEESRKDYVRRVADSRDIYLPKIKKAIVGVYTQLGDTENDAKLDNQLKGARMALEDFVMWIQSTSLEHINNQNK